MSQDNGKTGRRRLADVEAVSGDPGCSPQPGQPDQAPEPTTDVDTSRRRQRNHPLRRAGRVHHIGIGRTHAHKTVIVLIDDLDIRVVHTTTGELLRRLTLDPDRDYQPQKMTKARTPRVGPGLADVSRHHTGGAGGI